jgi:hypothetical protein
MFPRQKLRRRPNLNSMAVLQGLNMLFVAADNTTAPAA